MRRPRSVRSTATGATVSTTDRYPMSPVDHSTHRPAVADCSAPAGGVSSERQDGPTDAEHVDLRRRRARRTDSPRSTISDHVGRVNPTASASRFNNAANAGTKSIFGAGLFDRMPP